MFQPFSLYISAKFTVQNTDEELWVCFIIKKKYKNEEAKEVQAFKTLSWSASFPYLMAASNGYELLFPTQN